eukprot:scaffold36749_cov71-Phaeocystis_antarctica.AAC.1
MILSSIPHVTASRTLNVLVILPMQLKLSICQPLVASVTLAHSGGGDGDGGEGDGGGGLGLSPAAKSIGTHCGQTVLGFDEIGLIIVVPDPASLNTLRAIASSSGASTVEAVARSNGSHCGGHATRCSASASLLATLGLLMCGMTAAQKAAATPMRTSAQKRV